MNELDPNAKLKIRLTASPPKWAEAGVSALRQMPSLEILEGDSPVDDTPVDMVLHFGSYSDAVHQQFSPADNALEIGRNSIVSIPSSAPMACRTTDDKKRGPEASLEFELSSVAPPAL